MKSVESERKGIRNWLDDELIFYEDLSYKRSAAKIEELQKIRRDKVRKLSSLLYKTFHGLNIMMPRELLAIIVNYTFPLTETVMLAPGCRRIYVHLPQKLKTETFAQDLKHQFQEWWKELQTKRSCEFYFSDGYNNGDHRYGQVNHQPSLGGLVLHKGVDNSGREEYYSDDPYELHYYKWPLRDGTKSGFFQDLLHHKRLGIVFGKNVKPLPASSGVNFRQGSEGSIKTISLQERHPGNGYRKMINLAKAVGDCDGIEPSYVKKLPIYLRFKSRMEIQNFILIMTEALTANKDGSGAETNVDDYEGMMIAPGIYFRSIKNATFYQIEPCSSGDYGYCSMHSFISVLTV